MNNKPSKQFSANRLSAIIGLLSIPVHTHATPLFSTSVFNITIGYIIMLAFIITIFIVLNKKIKRYKELNKDAQHKLNESIHELEKERQQNWNKEITQNRLTTLFIENFRTPLASIVEPLKDITTKNTAISNSHNLNAVYRNSLMMLDLCEQIMGIYKERERFNKNEKLKITSKNIDLIIDNIVSRYNELIRVNQISFHYNKYIRPDFELWINTDTFRFIIYTLMTNAFIHTHYEGVINLTISETIDDENSSCMISISDNGKTSVKDLSDAALVIQSNENLTAVEFGYESIQKAVAQLHGTITMKSEDNIGTQIIMTFPSTKKGFEKDENIIFVTSEEAKDNFADNLINSNISTDNITKDIGTEDNPNSEITPAVIEEKEKKFRLLIIEERKDICLYLKVLLENTYVIITATDGQKGTDIAIKDNPDLIICDIDLPVKSGLDCCKELKENLSTCHIPFIMITTKAEDDEIVHALKSGADDYMLKPFTPSILRAKINSLINNRSMLQKTYTRLLVQLEGENGEKTEEDAKNRFVKEIVNIVENNLNNVDFSVKKLATDMNMSQPTLYRKVKQAANCSIIELITGVRIRRAGMLLKTKQYSVQEVAELVGYNDVSTFRKRFVEIFGTTPSAFADDKAHQVV